MWKTDNKRSTKHLHKHTFVFCTQTFTFMSCLCNHICNNMRQKQSNCWGCLHYIISDIKVKNVVFVLPTIHPLFIPSGVSPTLYCSLLQLWMDKCGETPDVIQEILWSSYMEGGFGNISFFLDSSLADTCSLFALERSGFRRLCSVSDFSEGLAMYYKQLEPWLRWY